MGHDFFTEVDLHKAFPHIIQNYKMLKIEKVVAAAEVFESVGVVEPGRQDLYAIHLESA